MDDLIFEYETRKLLPPCFDAIPVELKAEKRWAPWAAIWNEKRGKWDKVPRRADRPSCGLSTKADIWYSFDDAVNGYRALGIQGGIGYLLTGVENFVGIDLDDCVTNGEIDDWAKSIVDQANTYTEISPSGNGLRLFLRGDCLADFANHDQGIEVYGGHSARFLTVTGRHVTGTPAQISIATPEFVDAISSQYKLTRAVAVANVDMPSLIEDPAIPGFLTQPTRAFLEQGVCTGDRSHRLAAVTAELYKVTAKADGTLDDSMVLSILVDNDFAMDVALSHRRGDVDRAIEYLWVHHCCKMRVKVEIPSPKVFDTIDGPVEFDMMIDRTDTGNVNLLAKITDGDLRYVYETRAWISWDGKTWIDDLSGARAIEATRKVADYYFDKAHEIRRGLGKDGVNELARKGIEKAALSFDNWAMQCRNKSRIDAMLDLAKRDRRFEIKFNNLDRNPLVLGVKNGVVDLTTGQLRDASRDEFVTKRADCSFNPMAEAPRWQQFISEITGAPINGNVDNFLPRPDLAGYLQRAIGYSITGSTAEQKMFICHGRGSNGKNVILDMITRIFPRHVLTINPESLMANKFDSDGERATPVARQLAGARMAICSESRNTHQLDVATVKKHTGGGYMSARALHQAPISFEITHKVWLMTNHIPKLDHMDDAMRGRLHLIPFDRRWNRPGVVERDETIPDGDKHLPEKLKFEIEGILAWVVAGAVRYHNEGLLAPDIVTQTTTNYFQEQDGFNTWLAGMERVEDASSGMSATNALENYQEWCKSHGRQGADITATAFGIRLVKSNVVKVKQGVIRYGIRPLGLAVLT